MLPNMSTVSNRRFLLVRLICQNQSNAFQIQFPSFEQHPTLLGESLRAWRFGVEYLQIRYEKRRQHTTSELFRSRVTPFHSPQQTEIHGDLIPICVLLKVDIKAP
jgi:hypothetical protein